VLNKIDLLARPRHARPPVGRPGVAVSAVTGAGLDELRAEARGALLAAPDVAFLRVPLDQSDAVAKAVNLPHQLARRFDETSLEMAMRVDGQVLDEAGLEGFLVPHWEPANSDGGS
jgi:50S ribosomal subunit-associated GTPase HflX